MRNWFGPLDESPAWWRRSSDAARRALGVTAPENRRRISTHSSQVSAHILPVHVKGGRAMRDPSSDRRPGPDTGRQIDRWGGDGAIDVSSDDPEQFEPWRWDDLSSADDDDHEPFEPCGCNPGMPEPPITPPEPRPVAAGSNRAVNSAQGADVDIAGTASGRPAIGGQQGVAPVHGSVQPRPAIRPTRTTNTASTPVRPRPALYLYRPPSSTETNKET